MEFKQLQQALKKARHNTLCIHDELRKLKQKLISIQQKKDQLHRYSDLQSTKQREFLHSLDAQENELKKAIKELRRKVKRVKEKVVKIVSKDKNEPPKVSLGNKGYILKNGKFTYPAKIKIEVQPLSE